MTHPPEAMPEITLKSVQKWYGTFHALDDINLDIMRGRTCGDLRPSGSGKSTLIRCVNRLEAHQEGRIIVGGIELDGDVEEGRPRAEGCRHGFPAIQSLSAPDHSGELYPGTVW